MITYYRRTIRDKSLKQFDTFQKGMWISAINPSDEEITHLVETHNLDEFNVRGGLDEFELPRIEEEDGNYYIYANIMPKKFVRDLETFLVILTENAIITIAKSEPRFFKKLLETRTNLITTQKLKSLITMLSLINREFETVTRRIVIQVQQDRDSIEKLDEQIIADLLTFEDILNTFVTSYHYTNLVYERMMRRLHFFEDDKDLIEDLIIEGTQNADMCRSSLKTIGNIRSYIDIITQNRLNRILKVLTIFTVFISIPAALSGIYGMNIPLPFQNHPLSFVFLMGILAIIWALIYGYFKKSKIL